MLPTAIVADDHPAFRLGVVRALGRSGGLEVVAEAGNATEAVSALVRLRPDVAVLDLRMPGGDGIAVLNQARALVPGLGTQAVLLTADLDPDVGWRAAAAGFAASLPKATPRAELARLACDLVAEASLAA